MQAGTPPEGSGPQPAQTGARPGEHARVLVKPRPARVGAVTARWPSAGAHGTDGEKHERERGGTALHAAPLRKTVAAPGIYGSPGCAPTVSYGGCNGSVYGARMNGRGRESRKVSRGTGGSP